METKMIKIVMITSIVIIIVSILIPPAFSFIHSSVLTENTITIDDNASTSFSICSDDKCEYPISNSYFNKATISCYNPDDADEFVISKTSVSMLGPKNAYINVKSAETSYSLKIKFNYSPDKVQSNSFLSKVIVSLTDPAKNTKTGTAINWAAATDGIAIEGLKPEIVYSITIMVGYEGEETLSSSSLPGNNYLDISFEVYDGVNRCIIKNYHNQIEYTPLNNTIGGASLGNNNTTHDMEIVDKINGVEQFPDNVEAVVISNKEGTEGSFTDGKGSKPTEVQINTNGSNPFYIYLFIPDKNNGANKAYFQVMINGKTIDVNESSYIGYVDQNKTIDKRESLDAVDPIDQTISITVKGKEHSSIISLYILFDLNPPQSS